MTARESLASMSARNALNPYEIVADLPENTYATVGCMALLLFSVVWLLCLVVMIVLVVIVMAIFVFWSVKRDDPFCVSFHIKFYQ